MAKLDEAQALLSHTVSAGDLPTLIGLALDALCQQTLKRRFGIGGRRRGKGSPMAVEPDLGSAASGGDEAGQIAATVPGGRLDPDPVALGGGHSDRSTAPGSRGQLDSDPVAVGGDCVDRTTALVPDGRLDPDPVAADGDPSDRSAAPGSHGQLDLDPVAIGGEPVGQRIATAPAPRKGASTRIPVNVRAEVYLRDGGRCTFVGSEGRRCDSRSFLQLDHVTMACRGGAPTIDNCRLLCGAHNRGEARRQLGDDFVDEKVRGRGKAKRRAPEPTRRPIDRAFLLPSMWSWDDPLLLQILVALDGRALSIEDLCQTLGSAYSFAEVSSAVHALVWQSRVAFLPGRRRVARADQEHTWDSRVAGSDGPPICVDGM